MNSDSRADVFIIPAEAELFIETFINVSLVEVGSPKWNTQHEMLERLNMQAIASASQNSDEFVKEFLVNHDKVSVLIEDLLTTQIWKEKVLPLFAELKLEVSATFPIYIIVFHEGVILNLLETAFFHKDSVISADDHLLDLIDYCYQKLTFLVTRSECGDQSVINSPSDSIQELLSQSENLEFSIASKCISVMQYISDSISDLPLCAVTRMINHLDTIHIFIQLLQLNKFTRKVKGKLEKYIDNKWQVVTGEDFLKLSKIEGQVWLALYNLLLKPECQRKYQLNNFRKASIMKIRSHLTEQIIDQIPALMHLRQFVEQLAISQPPTPENQLIIEQEPQFQQRLLKQFHGKWEQIAKAQQQKYFNTTQEDLQHQAKRLAVMYGEDTSLIEPAKCAYCGHAASSRCSQCKNEWYCRRECQTKHWTKHKSYCRILSEAMK